MKEKLHFSVSERPRVKKVSSLAAGQPRQCEPVLRNHRISVRQIPRYRSLSQIIVSRILLRWTFFLKTGAE